ncbi:MAG: hypothetical protein LBT47_12770 [Deltaproteobacteria bacterium]|jgi:predicted transcriptional regulator of viral defense system|nr:hypothetical protein [Deltaproteobacteria bacterium]
MEAEEFLKDKPVFTNLELEEFLGGRSGQPYWSRVAFLARLRRDGRVVRVRRGLFATVDGEPELCGVDHLAVAARLTADAIITHSSVLEFLGLVPEKGGEVFYSAGRPYNPIAFLGRLYRGVKFPKSLVRSGQQHYLTQTTTSSGMTIKVASLERTLVDLIDRPDLAGGWVNTVKLLALIKNPDLDAVVEYTRALGNSTTAAKVGYYLTGRLDRLERLGEAQRHLIALSELKPNQPHYLDRSHRRDGHLVADWNLIVNCEEAL